MRVVSDLIDLLVTDYDAGTDGMADLSATGLALINTTSGNPTTDPVATNWLVTEAATGGNPNLTYEDRVIKLVQVSDTEVIGYVEVTGSDSTGFDDPNDGGTTIGDAIALKFTLVDA